MQDISLERMSLDDALRSVVLTAWDDLSRFHTLRAVRVEYVCKANVGLERAEIWLVNAGGYQDLVCDFRAGTQPENSGAWKCWTRVHSQPLTDSLQFVARHNRRFLLPQNGCEHGMVVVFPPAAVWQDRRETTEAPRTPVTALAKRAHAV